MRATFTAIAPQSLSERVASALKDAFFSGELKPGDAVVEREIARQMKVGTPVVREALIALQGQGFVRRVVNTGTYVSQFSVEEIRQLYSLRVELEVLAFQWARPRVTDADLEDLRKLVADVVQAGERADRRGFLECDYEFHRHCWSLSGNMFLAESLDRLMAPLFAFVVMASGAPLTASMGREHYDLIDALKNLAEPEFTAIVRKTLSGFAGRWLTVFQVDKDGSATAPIAI
jgi:DNA-binding GntR family transcriptional regulator